MRVSAAALLFLVCTSTETDKRSADAFLGNARKRLAPASTSVGRSPTNPTKSIVVSTASTLQTPSGFHTRNDTSTSSSSSSSNKKETHNGVHVRLVKNPFHHLPEEEDQDGEDQDETTTTTTSSSVDTADVLREILDEAVVFYATVTSLTSSGTESTGTQDTSLLDTVLQDTQKLIQHVSYAMITTTTGSTDDDSTDTTSSISVVPSVSSPSLLQGSKNTPKQDKAQQLDQALNRYMRAVELGPAFAWLAKQEKLTMEQLAQQFRDMDDSKPTTNKSSSNDAPQTPAGALHSTGELFLLLDMEQQLKQLQNKEMITSVEAFRERLDKLKAKVQHFSPTPTQDNNDTAMNDDTEPSTGTSSQTVVEEEQTVGFGQRVKNGVRDFFSSNGTTQKDTQQEDDTTTSNQSLPDPEVLQDLMDQANDVLDMAADSDSILESVQEKLDVLKEEIQSHLDNPTAMLQEEENDGQPQTRTKHVVAKELEAALQLHMQLGDSTSKELVEELAAEYKMVPEAVEEEETTPPPQETASSISQVAKLIHSFQARIDGLVEQVEELLQKEHIAAAATTKQATDATTVVDDDDDIFIDAVILEEQIRARDPTIDYDEPTSSQREEVISEEKTQAQQWAKQYQQAKEARTKDRENAIDAAILPDTAITNLFNINNINGLWGMVQGVEPVAATDEVVEAAEDNEPVMESPVANDDVLLEDLATVETSEEEEEDSTVMETPVEETPVLEEQDAAAAMVEEIQDKEPVMEAPMANDDTLLEELFDVDTSEEEDIAAVLKPPVLETRLEEAPVLEAQNEAAVVEEIKDEEPVMEAPVVADDALLETEEEDIAAALETPVEEAPVLEEQDDASTQEVAVPETAAFLDTPAAADETVEVEAQTAEDPVLEDSPTLDNEVLNPSGVGSVEEDVAISGSSTTEVEEELIDMNMMDDVNSSFSAMIESSSAATDAVTLVKNEEEELESDAAAVVEEMSLAMETANMPVEAETATSTDELQTAIDAQGTDTLESETEDAKTAPDLSAGPRAVNVEDALSEPLAFTPETAEHTADVSISDEIPESVEDSLGETGASVLDITDQLVDAPVAKEASVEDSMPEIMEQLVEVESESPEASVVDASTPSEVDQSEILGAPHEPVDTDPSQVPEPLSTVSKIDATVENNVVDEEEPIEEPLATVSEIDSILNNNVVKEDEDTTVEETPILEAPAAAAAMDSSDIAQEVLDALKEAETALDFAMDSSDIAQEVLDALKEAETALDFANGVSPPVDRKVVKNRRQRAIHRVAGRAFDVTVKGAMGIANRLSRFARSKAKQPRTKEMSPSDTGTPFLTQPKSSSSESPFFARRSKGQDLPYSAKDFGPTNSSLGLSPPSSSRLYSSRGSQDIDLVRNQTSNDTFIADAFAGDDAIAGPKQVAVSQVNDILGELTRLSKQSSSSEDAALILEALNAADSKESALSKVAAILEDINTRAKQPAPTNVVVTPEVTENGSQELVSIDEVDDEPILSVENDDFEELIEEDDDSELLLSAEDDEEPIEEDDDNEFLLSTEDDEDAEEEPFEEGDDNELLLSAEDNDEEDLDVAVPSDEDLQVPSTATAPDLTSASTDTMQDLMQDQLLGSVANNTSTSPVVKEKITETETVAKKVKSAKKPFPGKKSAPPVAKAVETVKKPFLGGSVDVQKESEAVKTAPAAEVAVPSAVDDAGKDTAAATLEEAAMFEAQAPTSNDIPDKALVSTGADEEANSAATLEETAMFEAQAPTSNDIPDEAVASTGADEEANSSPEEAPQLEETKGDEEEAKKDEIVVAEAPAEANADATSEEEAPASAEDEDTNAPPQPIGPFVAKKPGAFGLSPDNSDNYFGHNEDPSKPSDRFKRQMPTANPVQGSVLPMASDKFEVSADNMGLETPSTELIASKSSQQKPLPDVKLKGLTADNMGPETPPTELIASKSSPPQALQQNPLPDAKLKALTADNMGPSAPLDDIYRKQEQAIPSERFKKPPATPGADSKLSMDAFALMGDNKGLASPLEEIYKSKKLTDDSSDLQRPSDRYKKPDSPMTAAPDTSFKLIQPLTGDSQDIVSPLEDIYSHRKQIHEFKGAKTTAKAGPFTTAKAVPKPAVKPGPKTSAKAVPLMSPDTSRVQRAFPRAQPQKKATMNDLPAAPLPTQKNVQLPKRPRRLRRRMTMRRRG
ncbi:expressed unknown protein [Seminavis robusta]|uniref:Uncharacterized protein n=1 Tax=Seminavis robusta TaxID=568900 RepID=A0A9N8DVW5_9STRA|nr:expressed unknown protein [Seminavis robusta]|eukprot:Sro401_g135350.1 n/a (2176) ;mRNA; f:60377-66970